MFIRKKLKNALLIASLFSLVFMGCQSDHGLEPIRSNIHGVITYSGEWHSPPAEVRLVSATKFPPSGVSDLIIGESIPVSGDSYDYNFYLKPGAYKLVGVAWREQNSTWDIISICGLYFSGTDSLAPSEVIIPTDTSCVKNINIFVNRSKARRVTDSKIVGSIKFNGAWPDSVEDIRVIATTKFSLFPLELPSLLDISFSNGIVPGVDSADYIINAFPATYEATGVVMFKANQSFSLESIIALEQRRYIVAEDSTVAGPDFTIDFNKIPVNLY
ncbi:MAG: hypothetical protein K8R68_12825 [Bacteroidales bacterium]|nr:hypothetical protein [Bacteroidales bacterium]